MAWVLGPVAVRAIARRAFGVAGEEQKLGADLRERLQRLGVTYIKLGQFLATRFDILPEEVCRELGRLFDEVPPMSERAVRQVVASSLGRTVEEAFARFDWTCVAAASIAQVHRAVTHDGRDVAVKVQRPGIQALFASDMRILSRLARLADRLELLGPQSVVEALEEFETYTAREMDFRIEGRTAERLRASMGPHEDVPRIHWSLSSGRVLVMDFVVGHPLSKIIQLIEADRLAELERLAPALDLDAAVRNFAHAGLRQLFVTGFFHADPHPGNVFLREDGTVVFVDFGIFGQLSDKQRTLLGSYIEHVATGNIRQSYNQFTQLLQSTPRTDQEQLRREVSAMMLDWYAASKDGGSAVAQRHLGRYINEFIAIIRRNHARMSYGLLLFWRALMTLDATALRFQRQFDLLAELRAFFVARRGSMLAATLGPAAMWDRTLAVERTCREAPADLERARRVAEGSDAAVALDVYVTPERRGGRADPVKALGAAIAVIALLPILEFSPLGVPLTLGLWAVAAALAVRRA
jgi:ubiquinone biosynthesis protein